VSAEGDLIVNALVTPVGMAGLAIGSAALEGGALLAAGACGITRAAGEGLGMLGEATGAWGARFVRAGSDLVRGLQDAWRDECLRQAKAYDARFADRDGGRDRAIRAMAHLAQIDRARQAGDPRGDTELDALADEGRRRLEADLSGVATADRDLETWLAQVDQVRKDGVRSLEVLQQRHVGDLLAEALGAAGYAIVRDEAFGTDRRLSATRAEPRRRVVWRVAPGGRLAFDVTEGYEGRDCQDLLADVLDHLRRRGVRFTLGPDLDEVDRILRRVGQAFEAAGGSFSTEALVDFPAEKDRRAE